MIFFRIVILIGLWYLIEIKENSFLFNLHLEELEPYCKKLNSFLEASFGLQIEHPIYILFIILAVIIGYSIGKILDKSLGLILFLGTSAFLLYNIMLP